MDCLRREYVPPTCECVGTCERAGAELKKGGRMTGASAAAELKKGGRMTGASAAAEDDKETGVLYCTVRCAVLRRSPLTLQWSSSFFFSSGFWP